MPTQTLFYRPASSRHRHHASALHGRTLCGWWPKYLREDSHWQKLPLCSKCRVLGQQRKATKSYSETMTLRLVIWKEDEDEA